MQDNSHPDFDRSREYPTKVKIFHTDRLSSVNKMFIIWRKQEQFEYGRILTSVVCTDLTTFGLYFTTSVEILPYRPPARLIRANYRGQPKAGTGHKMLFVPFVFSMSRFQGPSFPCNRIVVIVTLLEPYNKTLYKASYYMALSHKDWELPNSQI